MVLRLFHQRTVVQFPNCRNCMPPQIGHGPWDLGWIGGWPYLGSSQEALYDSRWCCQRYGTLSIYHTGIMISMHAFRLSTYRTDWLDWLRIYQPPGSGLMLDPRPGHRAAEALVTSKHTGATGFKLCPATLFLMNRHLPIPKNHSEW